MSKFLDIPRNTRLIPKKINNFKIDNQLFPQKKEIIIVLLFNREEILI